jgi:dienelactone hydrolase
MQSTAAMQRAIPSLLLVALFACASSAGTSESSNQGGAPPPGGSDDGGTSSSGPDASARDAATGSDGAAPPTGFPDAGPDGTGPVPDAQSDGAMGGMGVYGSDGPDSVGTATVQVPAPNGTFSSTAYYPMSPGAHPVVILSSGFFQTALGYAPYAKRMASWGIVTFTRDDPGLNETAPSIAADVAYMVATWLPAVEADASPPAFGTVDTTHVGLAGHSRGGQVALLAAEGGALGHLRGVFGLDPVDTSTSGSPEARTQIATIGVPLAFVGETTDSAASGCAPATDNYQVLYQAAVSPAVAITAVNADHTMFEDPSNCTFCTLCTAGTANAATVLAYSVRYMTAFFARELLGDASVGAAFQGAGANQDVAAGLVQLVSK